MTRSDWISIIGIAVSTLMSLIMLALAAHIFQEEKKARKGDMKFSDFLKEAIENIQKTVNEILDTLKECLFGDTSKSGDKKDTIPTGAKQPADRREQQESPLTGSTPQGHSGVNRAHRSPQTPSSLNPNPQHTNEVDMRRELVHGDEHAMQQLIDEDTVNAPGIVHNLPNLENFPDRDFNINDRNRLNP